MKIAPDTNVLVRIFTEDDAKQAKLAETALRRAELVAVSSAALCELVWILSQGYKIPAQEISVAIRTLINSENVVVHRSAVDAGLAMLDTGSDFADGVLAHEGRALGADIFMSFDKSTVRRLQDLGEPATLLS